MNIQERPEFIDLVAQAVIDKIQEREQVNQIVQLVVERVIELQAEEANASTHKSQH